MPRVLVLNDDPVQLHLLATLLEQDQHEVLRCQSAEEAYDLLQSRIRVDVLVVDLHLPKMSGWRFCRLIRSLPSRELSTLPILVVSATYSGFDAEQIKTDLQVHGFLPMPVEPQRFRDCVRQLAVETIQPPSLRVLLVHEQAQDMGRLQYALEESGWLLRVARSGEDAQHLFSLHSFDVVIANHELPDMAGLHLLIELKRQYSSIVTVILASDSNSPSRREAFRLGVEAWFCKPYDPVHMVTECEKVRQEHTFVRVEGLLEARTNSLRNSETQFRTLFESLPDVLVVYDHALMIQHINRSGAQQLGYSAQELVGQSIHLMAPSGQSELGLWCLHGSGASIGEWRETQIMKKNGEMIDVELIERSVLFEGERGTLIVARDLRNRKQMESEKATLEHQLRQAQKMEAIGRLAAGVAHDVNNILAAILGHASLLKALSSSNEQLWHTGDVIDKAVRRGRQLTSQLLGFARQGKHHHVPVDVHGVIQEVISLLGQSVDKAISLCPVLEASQCWVMGDPNQLYQVLMNLALNACDAMPDGGTLAISTMNEVVDQETARRIPGLPTGVTLLVRVTDSGVGIPQEIRNKIFEPFFTTKEKGKGSGMGLAMTYGIVKNHQGYIDVSCGSEHGTTMKVYLPCTTAGAGSRMPTMADAPMQGQGHILVVDDDEVVASVAAELLEYLGYRVATVSSGIQAVEYCRKNKGTIDLVLLDMIMDGMNGAECFGALQEIDDGQKVIMCTGYDRNHAIQELLNQGVAGFIQKPYDIMELSEVIKEVLERVPHSQSGSTLIGKNPIGNQQHAGALVGQSEKS